MLNRGYNIAKWLCHFSESDIWGTCFEEFATREEAIEFGKQEAPGWGVNYFYIGTKEPLEHKISVDVDGVLEQIAENIYDKVGEVAEDYLRDVKQEHVEELQEKMDAVLHEWMEKHRYYPNFYGVNNVERINI